MTRAEALAHPVGTVVRRASWPEGSLSLVITDKGPNVVTSRPTKFAGLPPEREREEDWMLVVEDYDDFRVIVGP